MKDHYRPSYAGISKNRSALILWTIALVVLAGVGSATAIIYHLASKNTAMQASPISTTRAAPTTSPTSIAAATTPSSAAIETLCGSAPTAPSSNDTVPITTLTTGVDCPEALEIASIYLADYAAGRVKDQAKADKIGNWMCRRDVPPSAPVWQSPTRCDQQTPSGPGFRIGAVTAPTTPSPITTATVPGPGRPCLSTEDEDLRRLVMTP